VTTKRAFRPVLHDWWPSALVMAVIFGLSARPADALPIFGWADVFVKKGGHMLGYALLAAAYWKALRWKPRGAWMAWILAVAYGMSDELHQLLVPGRHASIWDVILFDATGAAIGLWIARRGLDNRPSI
jgi:hypothetical protein